jgi:hypothetical protein
MLTIISERIDDLWLLRAQLERMEFQPLLDEHFPSHGNQVGVGLAGDRALVDPHAFADRSSAEPCGDLV